MERHQGLSLKGRQLRSPQEGEEKWGKLTGGVVSHDRDRILKIGWVRWEIVSQRYGNRGKRGCADK